MSSRRVLLGLLLPITLLAAPASAEQRPAVDFTAPFTSASAPAVRDCSSGATCDVASHADATTGRGSTAVSYTRDAAAPGTEGVQGGVTFQQAVQLRRGSTGATVTATWHITSARASATSTRGFVYATGLLLTQVECSGGCSAPLTTKQVTLDCSQDGIEVCVNAPGADGTRVSGVDVVVTAEVRNLAKPTFTLRTEAVALVQAQPVCGPSANPTRPLPTTEDCSIAVDPLHAGSARSDIDATLVGLHIEAR